MRVNRVNRQTDALYVALVELWLDACHVTKLGGADRSEIFRMAEQNTPGLAKPFVKIDGALCCVGGEIWCGIAKTDGHGFLLLCGVLDLSIRGDFENPTEIVGFSFRQYLLVNWHPVAMEPVGNAGRKMDDRNRLISE